MDATLRDIYMMAIGHMIDACDWLNMYKYLEAYKPRQMYVHTDIQSI